ncbi:MAG: hypothetical protein LAP39_02250 [Acidobacteriia bacterium]|nr:hypothetical protein [Terriglobia bacterium]
MRFWKPILFPLAAVLLLANPLDCFSQLAGEQPSPCCASRHCNPAGQSRACCQTKLFENGQYYQEAKKSPVPAPDLSSTPVEAILQFQPATTFSFSLVDLNVHAPPGEPSTINLPLLI